MEHEIQRVHTETFKIHTYEVDMHNRLTIHALCQYLQEAASSHADALGFGVEYLLKNNRTWVLSRLAVKREKPVALGETITVRTWPSGTEKFFFKRDFIIENSSGAIIGTGASYWIFLDTEKMRPLPPSRSEITFDYTNLPQGFSHPLQKIEQQESPLFTGKFSVRYSDLDLNNHVNNITYIKWAMEGITPVYKQSHQLLFLQVNFLSEVKYGDEISLSMGVLPQERYFHRLACEGKDVCRIESAWGPLKEK